MADNSIPVIQTAGLTKTFKDFWRRDRVHAVRNLDIEIRRGEVFGLLGPNGSGKSTVIKMILGLLYPTKGRISVFGRPPTDVAIKSRIGFLPEESYLYRFLNASETLDYFGRLFRQHGRMRRDRIEKLLDMVGLRHEAKRRVGEYSKGMARRIGLAQALINDPDLLILDEPTSGMDPIGTRQIKDLIRSLADKGKTVLLSSHLLADVEDVCDHVSILYGGQQRAAGDIRELLGRQDRTQITTERLSESTIQKIRELLTRVEAKQILSVTTPSDRLENLFLRIVDEAQQANIETSGARAAGAIPEFLSKEGEGDALIKTLVSASDQPLAEPVVPPMASKREPEPVEQVVEELTQASETRQAEPVVPTATDGGDSAASPAGSPVGPDESIIDSLVSRNEEEGRE
ncbi:MAG: ATP-binding cassette domain-containing protein [Planctomycetes bacterium]|nr:ATP-binding cassette domain-containing protein [Planctomycetota bacterium]